MILIWKSVHLSLPGLFFADRILDLLNQTKKHQNLIVSEMLVLFKTDKNSINIKLWIHEDRTLFLKRYYIKACMDYCIPELRV